MPPKTSGWAIAALVFGIIGGILISVICAIVALNRTKDGAQRGRGMAIAGLVVSGVWTVLLILVIGVAVLVERGSVNATDVDVGDCIAEVPDSSRVQSVNTVPCTEPHEGEVYAVLTMPDGPYPGQAAIDEYQTRCAPELEAYSVTAMQDETIKMYVLYPSPETWEQGDHALTCVATSDAARTASIKG